MLTHITIAFRELTPFEQLILSHLCQGKSNVAIAAFRAHYGDAAFDRLDVACTHHEIDGGGISLCNLHIH